MKTQLTKYIAILLTCLLFSAQAYAQLPDIDDPSVDITHDGTPMDPFEIEIKTDSFFYSKNDTYNKGATSKLALYYRMEIEKPMLINLRSYSNVPLETLLQNEKGMILKTLYANGTLNDIHLEPGIYFIVQGAHNKDIYISISVSGKVVKEAEEDPNKPENYRPSQNMNYIRAIIATEKIAEVNSFYLLSKAQHNIHYFDHLGRPAQEIAYKASPNKKDIAAFREYDLLGRDSKQWLPVMRSIKSSRGTYISQDSIALFSQKQYADGAAFSYSVYEKSPFNRVVENYGPGEAWHSTGHSTKSHYRINTSADRCLYFSVAGTRDNPQLVQKGLYPTNELDVVETKDEDGHTGYSFTNREDQVVLNRNIAGTDTLDTYYVYDDFGNLCFVLPPAAVDNLTASPQPILDKYAYQYRYDYRHRCIGKKLPGCGWTEIMYDHNDRPVFTRDSEQQKRGEWSFTFSDLLDRQVLKGIYRGTLPNRETCDASDIYAVFEPGYKDARHGYRIYCPPGIATDKLDILQASYYDTYEYKTLLPNLTKELGYTEDSGYGKQYKGNQSFHCKDMLTGSMTTVLETGQKLYGAYYYDYDLNRIQERHTTVNGKTQVYKSSFNFSRQILSTAEEYDNEGALKKMYTYDHMGRLTNEVHIVGNDSTKFAYSYDDAGRLIQLARQHGEDVLTSTNEYNVRSWLKAIKSPLFSQTLFYTDGTGTPCYNGNISSMSWKTGSASTLRGYNFKYDGLNRMTDALYGEGNALTANAHRFDEQVTGYDKMGNILGLKRQGQTSQTAYGLIDNLSMVYDGNKLQSVNDNAASSAYNSSCMEFKDGAKKTVEYTYDTNGNLTHGFFI